MEWARTRWRLHGQAKQAVAYAQLNHGRWIIPCPFCPSAALYTGRNRFLCSECGNAAAGGRWVPVVLPPAEFLTALGQLIGQRPHAENRNWLPGETIEMITAENVEHGIA